MKKRKRLALIITTAVVVSMSMGNIAFAKTGVPVQEVEHIQYVSGEHNESKNQEVVEVQNTGEKEEQKDKESNIQDNVNIANMSKEDEAGVALIRVILHIWILFLARIIKMELLLLML